MNTADAIALATLASAILGDSYIAVIDYRYGRPASFALLGDYSADCEQDITPADLSDRVLESVLFYDDVLNGGDTESFHDDTITEAHRVLAAFNV